MTKVTDILQKKRLNVVIYFFKNQASDEELHFKYAQFLTTKHERLTL